MSARVTRRFDPSLLLRSENPMCLSDAKCVEWLFHSAHSSDVAQPLSKIAAANALNVLTARARMSNPPVGLRPGRPPVGASTPPPRGLAPQSPFAPRLFPHHPAPW